MKSGRSKIDKNIIIRLDLITGLYIKGSSLWNERDTLNPAGHDDGFSSSVGAISGHVTLTPPAMMMDFPGVLARSLGMSPSPRRP